jgi:sugar phosphate isomerase/epimerase
MAERGTKTTFILSDSRRAKLKKLAAERDTTVTELLAEGADLVLEKYRRVEDWETLQRRAKAARERMRAGLYSGPSVSHHIDDVVYPVRRAKRRRR